MNICKAFEMKDRNEQYNHLSHLIKLEDFGDYCNGHYLHTWDDGHRYLCKCPECNAFILVQFSEFHGYDDAYYKDFFAVESRKEAVLLNEKYDGWQIEKDYKGRKIFKAF